MSLTVIPTQVGIFVAAIIAFATPASAAPTIATETAVLRALNKTTGRATDIEIPVGSAKMFETMGIEVKACYAAPVYDEPENAAFLKIIESQTHARENKDKVKGKLIFSGWLFSSSPSISAVEHPNFDIWVLSCK